MIRHGEKQFGLTIASNVIRDGVALELEEIGQPSNCAEVFFYDATGEMTISTFGEEFPLAVIEELITLAKTRLPPLADKT